MSARGTGAAANSYLFDGAKLAAWREKEGFASQGELAHALGYTRTVVTHLEAGKLQPSRRFVVLLDGLLEKLHARKKRPGPAPVSRAIFYVRRRA